MKNADFFINFGHLGAPKDIKYNLMPYHKATIGCHNIGLSTFQFLFIFYMGIQCTLHCTVSSPLPVRLLLFVNLSRHDSYRILFSHLWCAVSSFFQFATVSDPCNIVLATMALLYSDLTLNTAFVFLPDSVKSSKRRILPSYVACFLLHIGLYLPVFEGKPG